MWSPIEERKQHVATGTFFRVKGIKHTGRLNYYIVCQTAK